MKQVIVSKISKAYSMLGFLKRVCADFHNVKELTSIYNTHVSSHRSTLQLFGMCAMMYTARKSSRTVRRDASTIQVLFIELRHFINAPYELLNHMINKCWNIIYLHMCLLEWNLSCFNTILTLTLLVERELLL